MVKKADDKIKVLKYASIRNILLISLFQDKETFVSISLSVGFVSSLIIILFLVSHYNYSFDIEKEDYRLLVTTSAAIIATILAVSFSISILGIQHALGNFAPSLLRHFISDKATTVSFSILSFSSVICLTGLILPWKDSMTALSLFLLPFSFLVLAYYFNARSKTTTSLTIFEKIKNDVKKYIKNSLDKNLQKEMKVAFHNRYLGKVLSKMNDEQKQTVENSLFHSTNILSPIKKALEDVIGLILRSLPSNDYESIEHGFDTIGGIIEYYINVRRDSEEDKIIESLYEQIKSVTLVSIEKNNPYLLKKIVKTYESVAILTTNIKLPRGVTNYQFTGLAIHYLNEIFYSVRSFGDIDLEIIHSIRNIGTSSVLHGGDDVLAINYYTKIIDKSENVKHFLFYREIIGATTQIIRASIHMKVNEISLKLYLEDLTKMGVAIINRVADGTAFFASQPLLDPTFPRGSIGFPNNCQVMVRELLDLKKTMDDDFFARTLEKHAFETVPFVVNCVINISNAAVKRKYPWIVRDATTSLYNITSMLLEERFLLELNFDDDIKEIIYSMSYFFTEFFKSNEDLNYYLEDEILDALTMMGLQLVKYTKYELANLLLGQLLAICIQVAKFDKFGYSTARIAKRIMMIGLFSMELNVDNVTKKVLESLDKYDTNVKKVAIQFQKKSWALDELVREIKEHDNELIDIHEISPNSFLRQNISHFTWSKFRFIVG